MMPNEYYWILSEDAESDDPPKKAIVVQKGQEWSLVQWKHTMIRENIRTARILLPAAVVPSEASCAGTQRVDAEKAPFNMDATFPTAPAGTKRIDAEKAPSNMDATFPTAPAGTKRIDAEKAPSNNPGLPREILRNGILPLLRPRELLNFCSTSKFWLSQLSHELVIRSVDYRKKFGEIRNTPGKRMVAIASLLENGDIHAPTPIRMLRLLLGTRCEQPDCRAWCSTMVKGTAMFLCDQCWKYGLPNTPHQKIGPMLVTNHDTYVWNFNFKKNPLRKIHHFENDQLLKQSYVAPTGELAGPLFTVATLEGGGQWDVQKAQRTASKAIWGIYQNVMATLNDCTDDAIKPPEPPRSAFECFKDNKKLEIMKKEGITKDNDDLLKVFASAWKSLSEKEKAYWDEEARNDKVRFVREKAEYKGPWNLPKRRVKKPPNAPTRPMSAFLRYSKARRMSAKEANPSLSNTDISFVLGEMWRNAPDAEKAPYIEAEIVDTDKYNRWMAKWREEKAQSDAAASDSYNQHSWPDLSFQNSIDHESDPLPVVPRVDHSLQMNKGVSEEDSGGSQSNRSFHFSDNRHLFPRYP